MIRGPRKRNIKVMVIKTYTELRSQRNTYDVATLGNVGKHQFYYVLFGKLCWILLGLFGGEDNFSYLLTCAFYFSAC